LSSLAAGFTLTGRRHAVLLALAGGDERYEGEKQQQDADGLSKHSGLLHEEC
jgi:hypothetical protein